MSVAKIRRCTECKQVFATPESFRSHKRVDGACRTPEALLAVGFQQTSQGWKSRPPSSKK
jgi:hypothetical protein